MFNRFYGDNVLIMIEQLSMEVWDANLVSLFKITNLFVYKKIPHFSLLVYNNSFHVDFIYTCTCTF